MECNNNTELRSLSQVYLLLESSGGVIEHAIHHPSHCEHSSYYSTDPSKEVSEGTSVFCHLDQHGAEVIEEEDS